MANKPKGGFSHGGRREGAGAPRQVIKLRRGQTLTLVPSDTDGPSVINVGQGAGGQSFHIVYIEADAIWLQDADPAANQEPIKLAVGGLAE